MLVLPIRIFAQDCVEPRMDERILKGFVYDYKSKEPFPAVIITLFDKFSVIKTVLSDLNGKFIMQVPRNNKLSDSLKLEFVFYEYKPAIIKGNIFNIKELNIEMYIDTSKYVSKEMYLRMYRERYDYNE
jgi:hypothetical protein